jgi:hypothetical protein
VQLAFLHNETSMSSSVPILALPVIDTRVPALESPQVVQILDRIRFETSDAHPDGEMDEFAWFAREYPRAYRHHLECADFRITTIAQLYAELHRDLVARLDHDRPPLELGLSDIRVKRIYWDFESFLGEIGSALDLLARIVGVAYKIEMPPNFNKFCRKEIANDPYLSLFRTAQERWVNRMKDYRDCFVHYTPADTQLSIRLVRRANGYETRCKLPINPNERDITRFRFPLSIELLRYAISLQRNMRALDRAVASLLKRGYRDRSYPVRTQGLLTVGRRERSKG